MLWKGCGQSSTDFLSPYPCRLCISLLDYDATVRGRSQRVGFDQLRFHPFLAVRDIVAQCMVRRPTSGIDN